MKIRALIINSPLFAEKQLEYNEDYLPPIGLGYIATNLRNFGHSVRLVDAVSNNLTVSELLEMVGDIEPDVVAMNIFTTNYKLVREFVESIHDARIRVLIGGLSTRTLFSDIFKWNSRNQIDIVCGDGELLAEALVSGTEVESPVATNKNKRFFSVSSKSEYFVSDISEVPLDRGFFANEPLLHPRGFREVSMVTSRGCIFNCAFCASARSLNKALKIREMTEAAVIRDLNDIQKCYPNVTHIRILDDLFLKNTKSINKAVRVFKGFPYKWRAMAHVQTVRHASDAELESLRENGCIELFFGIESGSPDVLRKIRKTSDIGVILDSLQSVMVNGISLKTYFIYGFPNETREDFARTYKLAQTLHEMAKDARVSFRTSVFQFRPYHGTEIYYELLSRYGETRDMKQVSENKKLSSSIGRNQFNFESGNYSRENDEVLVDFIKKTLALEVSVD